MSTPEVTTDVPAEVVFFHCCDYLDSLEKAKDQTVKNFYMYYRKQTEFSLLKMKRVPKYTHEQALERAKSSASWQFVWDKGDDVVKIKNLAFRDLSATMQVNYEAWNMIHRRFTASTPENRYYEDF